jgi:hypothetical protein
MQNFGMDSFRKAITWITKKKRDDDVHILLGFGAVLTLRYPCTHVSTRRQNPENHHHPHRRENLKSHKKKRA